MKMEEAAKLKKESNGSPCDHSHVVKEIYLGSPTGDYACTQCGESGWGSSWANERKGGV